MKDSSFIDLIQRKVNSFLFRTVLIAYSLAILIFFDNIFPTYIYIISFFLYLILYFVFKRNHTLRLLNDFLFIIIVSLGKNPNEIFVFLFILLPIFNCINFSGTKKSQALYPFTALTFYALSFFYIGQFDFKQISLFPLLSLFFLWIIEAYTSRRVKVRDFIENMNDFVDDFYLNKEYLEKPHKIYPILIEKINHELKTLSIVDIFCFIRVKISEDREKLVLVNSSKFIWNSRMNEKNIIKQLKKNKYLLDFDVVIGDEKYPFNIVLPSNIEDTKYVFILTTNKKLPFYYRLIGFTDTLKPIFAKVTKILLSEKKFEEIEREELYKLSQRSQYVTRATKAMHHIRNRLTPISNLIKMLDNTGSVSESQKDKFNQLLNTEKERAKNELEHITNRANYLLEKANNPFNFTEKKPFKLPSCYTLLARNLNVHFPNEEIEIKWERDLIDNVYVLFNYEGFELFLTDWLNNMYKYNNNKLKLVFHVKEDVLSIEFWNNYPSNGEAEVQKMIADLMSTGRNEIMKRTTHGLYQIKTCLEEMEIDFQISKINKEVDFVCLVINLKLNQYENSNI